MAFPRTHRKGFELALEDHAGIRYGIWALLCSCFEWDSGFGGLSVVRVIEGVPEGSVIAPMVFRPGSIHLLGSLVIVGMVLA